MSFMHKIQSVARMFLFLLLIVPQGWAQDQVITIGVGTQKVLQMKSPVQRISIGDPDIADVKALNSTEVLVVGLAKGRTTLLIWLTSGDRLSYTLSVRLKDPKEVVAELKALLGDMEGISMKIVGDNVYLDGETLTTEDADRVARVVQLYPELRSFVHASQNATRANAKNIDRVLKDNGIKTMQVNVVGNTTFLEGFVESKEDLDKATAIVKALGAQVENMASIGLKRMILVEAQFVEIRRADTQQIGLKYPLNWDLSGTMNGGLTYVNPAVGGQAPVQKNATVAVGGGSSAALQMRFNNGYGRSLSQPKLVCASGEKAHMVVGGEIPLIVVTQNAVNVQFKEFGIILDVTPTADRNGNIDLAVDSTISDVDASLSVSIAGTQVPGFLKREAKTTVTVKSGDSIVLSGLFNHDQQKSVDKVPLLGHIPIIGELFKSREFREKKTELIVFITPKLVNPEDDRIRGLIDTMKIRYKDSADSVGYSIFD